MAVLACNQVRGGRRAGDGLPDHTRGHESRLQNLLSIGRAVRAIDAAAGEIDEHIRAIDLALPGAQSRTIPFRTLVGRTELRLSA